MPVEPRAKIIEYCSGAVTNPSYVPALMSGLTDKKGFFERAYRVVQ